MATIIRETLIDVDAATAWGALADFGALSQRLARGFVTSCRLDAPDVRTITFANGAAAREQLVGIDAGARRLAYTVFESALGATFHHASAQMLVDGNRTRFVWIIDVLPDSLAPGIARLMDHGCEAIKATLECRDGLGPPTAQHRPAQ